MFSPKIGSKMNLHISPVHTPDKCDLIFSLNTLSFSKNTLSTPPGCPQVEISRYGQLNGGNSPYNI